MKYPKAGDLQRATGVEITSNPARQNPYEVHSASGLEGIYADEQEAQLYADELMRDGVRQVRVVKRHRVKQYGSVRSNPGSDTIIKITYRNETIILTCDLSQASAPLIVDGEVTPYQTASARHRTDLAVALAARYAWPESEWPEVPATGSIPDDWSERAEDEYEAWAELEYSTVDGPVRSNPGSEPYQYMIGDYDDPLRQLLNKMEDGGGKVEVCVRQNPAARSNPSDREIAMRSLEEEQRAACDYGSRIRQARDPGLRHAMEHARREEIQHAESLRPFVNNPTHPAQRDYGQDIRGLSRSPALGDRYVLGTYAEGSRVQLADWEFPSYNKSGVLMPGDWVTIVRNGTKFGHNVTVRIDRNKATVEKDGLTPLWEIDPLESRRNPAGLTASVARRHVADVLSMGHKTAAQLAVEDDDDALDGWSNRDILAATGAMNIADARTRLASAIRAEARRQAKQNPAGLTAKGERMYEQIRRGYEERGEPRAKEIASRTVMARSRTVPGLKKK